MKLPAGACALLVSAALAWAQPAIDLSPYKLRSIYTNDFGKPQKIAREEDFIEQSPGGAWRRKAKPAADAEWIAEGWGGVEIRTGKMRVTPLPIRSGDAPGGRSHMVVWNRRVLPADFLLAFDMNAERSTNGLTIVFLCATGKHGDDIFDLALPPRRADYSAYHSGEIVNYSDSYWSRNTPEEGATNRLRKNPGFRLVAEAPSLTAGPADVTHRLRILKIGAHIEVEMDGTLIMKWTDPEQPLGAGRIGLRSMEGVTAVSYSNLQFWSVAPR